MPRKLDPTIAGVLQNYGFGTDACWDCHGTWVVYHRVLEMIAAQAGIEYDAPTVLVAEKEAAAILVVGRIGDKVEWTIGEAVVGLNYKVSAKQAGYPFAMAEKRAKDRVILKLIGLHGLAYSEEEADSFKQPPKTDDDHPATEKASEIMKTLYSVDGQDALREYWAEVSPHVAAMPDYLRTRLVGVKDEVKRTLGA